MTRNPRRPDVTEAELVGGIVKRPLELHAYDPAWAETYEQHRARILAALHHEALLVEHIGSTSVPGLAAKPIIDILLMVSDITAEEDWLPRLLDAGYELRVREPGHRMVRTPEWDAHVHILERADPAAGDYLLLRDRLRTVDSERELYEATKRDLVTRDWSDMNAYADAKTEVIEAIKARARAARGNLEIDYACVALLDPRGWLLMQERDEHAPVWPELWGLPGGGVEAGEDALATAVRELAEETGLSLAPSELTSLAVVSTPTVLGTVTGAFFVARVDLSDADVECHEGRQMTFVAPEEIGDRPLTPSAQEIAPEVFEWSAAHPPVLGERRFAGVILVDPRGWILLQERDEHPRIDPEKWGLSGGHVEAGETFEEAAPRELEEETGVRLPDGSLEFWREFVVDHRRAHGTWDRMQVFVARVELTDDDLECHEGRQFVFVDPVEALRLPLTSAATQIVPAFLADERWNGPRTIST
jgi:GrpB-like predicted nucleotidyltransferase (UPF0157 family)/ADP-ribose pyrophosphatase YjhB (NUDIX family)